MRAAMTVLLTLAILPTASDVFAADCAPARKPAATLNTTQSTPIASELAAPNARSGLRASSGSADVDSAVSRMQLDKCRADAAAAAARPTASATAPQGGGSYRFNMTQNGKRMTADDFDAWMKANGVRVVQAPKPAAPPPPPPADQKKKKP